MRAGRDRAGRRVPLAVRDGHLERRLTARPGGDRWRWESRLFDGQYDDAAPSERPVYGAWNRRSDPYGGSPRFGSSYLRLRPDVVARSTFCFPDSVFEPTAVGRPDLLPHLCHLADAVSPGADPLDDYVEAHVHGPVRLGADVEALVLDPCFAGTHVEHVARTLPCDVEWHAGFRVTTAGLDPSYRGQEVVDLAQSLGAVLTPSVIGDAARAGAHDPQLLKKVWHLLTRFGRA